MSNIKERPKLLKQLEVLKKKLNIIGIVWGRFCTEEMLKVVIKELEEQVKGDKNVV